MPEASLKWLSPKVQAHWFAKPTSAWDQQGDDVNQIAQQFQQKQASSAGGGWRIGQGVQHGKFGEGVIVNIEGSGSNARAHINFGQFGMKLLDLNVAKLEKLAH
jgi:DNA helicase-2/ATP-dependent DNA helicase PcrA